MTDMPTQVRLLHDGDEGFPAGLCSLRDHHVALHAFGLVLDLDPLVLADGEVDVYAFVLVIQARSEVEVVAQAYAGIALFVILMA